MNEKYKDIIFTEIDGNYFEINNHIFVKNNDGILSCKELDIFDINILNGAYPKDVQEMIFLSHERYSKKTKKVYQNRCDKLIEKQTNDILYLESLAKVNEKEVKRVARESLARIGIINENGDIIPPYNGENVNPDDFTRGPKLIKRGNKG